MTAPLFLAEFQPLSPNAQLAIVSLLVVTQIVVSIIALWPRRKPPLGEHLVQLQSAIAELKRNSEAMEKGLTDLTALKLDHTALSTRFDGFEKQHDEDVKAARRHTDESVELLRKQMQHSENSIQTALQNVSNTVNAEFKTLYRAVGKAEGHLEHLQQ